ncbi:unnamed protein product [Ilex paraguariensis]|uniref:Protein kinase domain-containing protein n=1 Tax=Ilex paraguariensis TaxID=185542 RepID=A0ABC8T4J3_9AQUA
MITSASHRKLIICAVFMIQIRLITIVKSIEINEYFPDERDALMQIRDIVNSSSNLHANWTGPPCHKSKSQWAGIVCSNWHVTHLVLENIQLTGSLPPTFLQNLTFLSKLSFRNNSIHGPLPSLKNLMNLEFVFLSHNQFSGSIPLNYIELPKLAKLELQNNSLGGSIPPFDQQTLKVFNVSYNQLDGEIPDTRVLQRFSKSSYDHNSNLCGRPVEITCPVLPLTPPPVPYPPSKKKNKVVLKQQQQQFPSVSSLFFSVITRKSMEKKERRQQWLKQLAKSRGGHAKHETIGEHSEVRATKTHWSQNMEDPERTVELQFFDKNRVIFDLDDLLRASAEVIGKGKLGTTYKAMLESGSVVAVKRLKHMNALSKKEFVQQMQLLGNLRHENLVEIVSFYYSKEEKLIIYDFVPNGNLFELLHENRGRGRIPLNWTTRLSIIKDIAKGLTFLQQSLPSHKVPHGNLNSSNVLIHWNSQTCHSKLTDFGFFPLLQSRKLSENLAVGKTPEFFRGKKLTCKADVYCFGIVLLEIITGKIPGQNTLGDEGTSADDLSDWVRTVVNTDWSTDILDIELLAGKEGHAEILKLTKIAFECTDMAPENRPKMNQVLRRIEEIDGAIQERE